MPIPTKRVFWLLAAAVAQVSRVLRWIKRKLFD
ncbi:hypothetical protein SAMN05443545_101300 [Aidingimonas halophila]|uniref:Uncharacterized protein n=1 Tax=Aidingimonas halophila TaxID=574349 RepID=A0A1H2RG35_9GAMM|nr:hypothetical protein SAMN05443545_101300 [Aidingimonas halophila]